MAERRCVVGDCLSSGVVAMHGGRWVCAEHFEDYIRNAAQLAEEFVCAFEEILP